MATSKKARRREQQREEAESSAGLESVLLAFANLTKAVKDVEIQNERIRRSQVSLSDCVDAQMQALATLSRQTRFTQEVHQTEASGILSAVSRTTKALDDKTDGLSQQMALLSEHVYTAKSNPAADVYQYDQNGQPWYGPLPLPQRQYLKSLGDRRKQQKQQNQNEQYALHHRQPGYPLHVSRSYPSPYYGRPSSPCSQHTTCGSVPSLPGRQHPPSPCLAYSFGSSQQEYENPSSLLLEQIYAAQMREPVARGEWSELEYGPLQYAEPAQSGHGEMGEPFWDDSVPRPDHMLLSMVKDEDYNYDGVYYESYDQYNDSGYSTPLPKSSPTLSSTSEPDDEPTLHIQLDEEMAEGEDEGIQGVTEDRILLSDLRQNELPQQAVQRSSAESRVIPVDGDMDKKQCAAADDKTDAKTDAKTAQLWESLKPRRVRIQTTLTNDLQPVPRPKASQRTVRRTCVPHVRRAKMARRSQLAV